MTKEFPDLDDVDGELGILIRGELAAVKASGQFIDLMHEYPGFTASQEDSTVEDGEIEELVGHMSLEDVGFTGWE